MEVRITLTARKSYPTIQAGKFGQYCADHTTSLLIDSQDHFWCVYGHRPLTWLVVDERTGEIVAAGRDTGDHLDPEMTPAIWLKWGPESLAALFSEMVDEEPAA